MNSATAKLQPVEPIVRVVVPRSGTFKYKINYVAAWPDYETEEFLVAAGIPRRVHMTTFFDCYGQMSSVNPFPWAGVQLARIAAVVEWKVGDDIHLIAEMMDCSWSQQINDHYRAQGVVEDLPHCPHIALDKRVPQGTAARFQHLVGAVLCFDRHGGQHEDERPPMSVEGDVVLRDWKFERINATQLAVTTPPLAHGIRETHRAKEGEALYTLANALLTARRPPASIETP